MRALVVGFIGAFVLLAAPSYGQGGSVGKGWLLSAGSITSATGEMISGTGSIKATGTTSKGTSLFFLETDPSFVRFLPSRSYTMTWSYRIITPSDGGFSYGFQSSEGNGVGNFGPSEVLRGAAGSSGTATTTFTLGNHGDYRVQFAIDGPGSIVVDDIRITDASGQIVASETAEGPNIVPGPLNFRLTDSMSRLPGAGATIRSAAAKDLDGDGYPEAVLTLTAPPPSTTPLEPVIVEASGRIRIATGSFFPAGAPTVKHSPATLFHDINNDGRDDIVFADAGSDMTPTPTGSAIGVALNMGGGKYRNVSPFIPADLQTTRSYAVAVGDIDNDGVIEILLPDQDDGSRTALLRWNGSGFDAQRNWIDAGLWTAPTNLVHNDSLAIDDFDKDGRSDLFVGANPVPGTPNIRMLFGAAGGFTAAGVLQLPDGLFGHAPSSDVPIAQTADVAPVVVADFNNDGLPDIFSGHEQVIEYKPGTITDTNEPDYEHIRNNGGGVFADFGFQILINQGSRRFTDVTKESTPSNLGRRHYFSFIPADMNNDAFLDVVALYQTKSYGSQKGGQRGTTLFLNDGTGAFQVVEGSRLLASVATTPSNGQQWELGAFVPTLVTPLRTEGIAVESVGGCGLGFCAPTALNLYKVSASGSIGTGPNFVDPETLGAPGFNEFYYLRHYPDAAAAVAAGQYKTGLEHYLAVGTARGYRSHAVICASCPLPFGSVDTPVEGASNLSGSIAIGGWALSPSGITAVRILRAPIAGEGSQPIPVGTAVRLAGARPDVAAAYPTHVGKERAGWGYLLLTNVLPNQGNGTYTLYVYADDADGRSALIGTRTITVNNAAATRPFGAIDTPAQGEIVSGTYVNFGWVVTPKPKMIPKDGSTITVYVDGVPLGHPTYDQYRADIAGLFPGLDNANGAVGAFVIDTTKLANGIHTISWLVTDSAGVSEGIGSRFFTVQNPR